MTKQIITPHLWYDKEAKEASDFYLSVFKDSKRGAIARYPAGMKPEKEGAIMFTDFNLEGQWFAAMDSAQMHDFTFNEAVSLKSEVIDGSRLYPSPCVLQGQGASRHTPVIY